MTRIIIKYTVISFHVWRSHCCIFAIGCVICIATSAGRFSDSNISSVKSITSLHHIWLVYLSLSVENCEWFAVTQTITSRTPSHTVSWDYIRLFNYQSVSVANREMYACMCVCPSAPGFTLSSASGQTVCPLPGALHEGEGLTTTLLHRQITHVSAGKVNLWGHEGSVSSCLQLLENILHADILGHLFSLKYVIMTVYSILTW